MSLWAPPTMSFYKQSPPLRYLCVGLKIILDLPFGFPINNIISLCVGCQLKSDQAIKSLCLKGHVRARGSTLWRHRWQEASEILCTNTPLFGESWATKNIAKKTRKCSLRRATNVMFSNFLGQKPRSTRFFETALRAVLINLFMNSLIRINSGPNILRSGFLYCP